MKKYILIILAILALIIAAFAAVSLFTTSDATPNDVSSELDTSAERDEQELDTMAENQTFQGTDSIETLARLGVPVECEIKLVEPEDNTSLSGTYFHADGNVRGDFLQTTPGMDEPVLASMIMVDDMLYTWSEIEGEQFGIKFDISEQADAEVNDQRPINPNDQVEYNCRRWQNVDASIFEPPRDVLFQDMSALMEAGMEYGTVYDEGEF